VLLSGTYYVRLDFLFSHIQLKKRSGSSYHLVPLAVPAFIHNFNDHGPAAISCVIFPLEFISYLQEKANINKNFFVLVEILVYRRGNVLGEFISGHFSPFVGAIALPVHRGELPHKKAKSKELYLACADSTIPGQACLISIKMQLYPQMSYVAALLREGE
jgi:hypothetical protein